MLDYAAIRGRAFAMQENSGLGTAPYALSQDVLSLLEEMQRRDQQDYRAKYDAVMRGSEAVEYERDEARELHAAVCAKYADAVVRLHRISNIIAGYQSAHSKDNVEVGPDKEAVAMNGRFVGTVLSDGYAVGE